MNVWLIKDGEQLPLQDKARKMRTWFLADALRKRGHKVQWWASTFSHSLKKLLRPVEAVVESSPDFRLRLLHAGEYRSNVSLGRYWHHRKLGARFRVLAPQEPIPNIVVCAFPVIDLAHAAVQYARERGIPVVVDVRDLWPDTYFDMLPRFLHAPARWLLARDFAMTRETLSCATGVVAISEGCLHWGLQKANRGKGKWDRVFYTGYSPQVKSNGAMPPKIEAIRVAAQGAKIFVFVGAFGRSYGLRLLCEVARRFAAAGRPDIFFVFAGDGDQFRAVAAAARGLENVVMPGWLQPAEIDALLGISYAGIVPGPDVLDAMPNKAFEYLAAGLPLISSLRGEMESMIQHEDVGFSYRQGSVESLCEAVERLAMDPSRRSRQAENASRLFQERFRAEDVYDQYARYVEAVAASAAQTASAT